MSSPNIPTNNVASVAVRSSYQDELARLTQRANTPSITVATDDNWNFTGAMMRGQKIRNSVAAAMTKIIDINRTTAINQTQLSEKITKVEQ